MKKLSTFLFSLFITLVIQAQVSKSLDILAAGDLSSHLTAEEKLSVTDLILTGTIDARDFNTMRMLMPALKVLDISRVSIAAYKGTAGTMGTDKTDYLANKIPEAAFQSYSNIASIILPSSVTSIGDGAFWDCNWLIDINIPSSVTTIGSGAFVGCRNLKSIVFPSTISTIRELTFWSCSNLKSFTIPSSVTSIGANAFDECTSLTSIIIPPSVDSIANGAFTKCSRLSSIYVPSTVISLSSSAFYGCGLMTVDENNPNYSSLEGVLYNKDKTVLLNCPIFKKDSFEIPLSVKSVGKLAFNSCQGLTSIILPSSVTSLGEYAFAGCKKLTSITIPSTLTAISRAAFSQCTGLKTVNIPSSVTSIGRETFYYCYALDSIMIPSSVTSIGAMAFGNCTSLKYISIPTSVTMIDGAAFRECKSLKSIILPSSVKSIIGSTFIDCDSLTSIIIPSSVTSIDDKAFSGCTSLRSIILPSSVTSIGTETFKDCSNLTSIYLYGTKPTNLCNVCRVFEGVVKTNCILYVPFGSKNAYKSAMEWKTFPQIIEMKGLVLSSATLAIPGDGGTSSVDLKSNTSWSLTSDESWLNIIFSHGTGDTTLYFMASVNPTSEMRTAKVKVSGEGFDTQSIVITQSADITAVNLTQNRTMGVYPNPATDVLNVNYPNGKARIILFDISGRRVLDRILSDHILNISCLPVGLYNVRIISGEEMGVFKFMHIGF